MSRVRMYEGVKCKKRGCGKQAISKSLCSHHYYVHYYEVMSPERRKRRAMLVRKVYGRYKEKRRNDPEFDEKERRRLGKTARESFKRRCERDPGWNARRQREHRRRNPDSFNFTMAKWYFLKLKGKYKRAFMEMMRDG